MKTVLLTGTGGFIGGNLKEYLKDKYKLLTPRSFELNLCDRNAVKDYFQNYDIDFIIHCAVVGGIRGEQDPENTINDNLSMVDNLLENKKESSKVIFFGSGAMYDRFRELHKVKEKEIGKHIPSELYGSAKLMLSQKIKNREDALCMNIFACYGRGEKASRFPSYAITQNLNHKKIEINKNVIFDYLYIDDLLKIVEFFIENKPKYNIFNVTPTDSISLKEIAEVINEISDFKSEIVIKDSQMNFEYTGDNSKLMEMLPNFRFTTYKEGLKKLYLEYKSRLA